MKKTVILILSIWFFAFSYGQKNIQFSEKQKLEMGAYGMSILGTHGNSVYFLEKKDKLNFITSRVSTEKVPLPKISKFNKETLVFEMEREYKEKLEKYDFYDVKYLDERIFLFCTANKKKDLGFTLYGFEIDNQTLSPKSELKEIASFDFPDEDATPEKLITPSADSTHFIITAPLDKKNWSIGFAKIDLSLSPTKVITINQSVDTRMFCLNTTYTQSQKIIMTGLKGEDVMVGKKKKVYILKAGIVAVYDNTGKHLQTISCNDDGHIMLSTTLLELPGNKSLITGFYTTDIANPKRDGIYMAQIGIDDGSKSSVKYLSFADEQKKLSTETVIKTFLADNNYGINSVSLTPDKENIIIVAENYSENLVERDEYRNTFPGAPPRRTETVRRMETIIRTDLFYKNIALLNLSLDAVLNWATMIPKEQIQQIMDYSPAKRYWLSSGWADGYNSFGSNGAYYGSLKTFFDDKTIYIYMNDDADNRNVVSLEQKPNKLNGAKNLRPFLLGCDYNTGKITRQELSDDPDDTVPFFTRGFHSENSFYFPTRSHTGLDVSKFQYKIGKIVIK